jgi:hypothetical protein
LAEDQGVATTTFTGRRRLSLGRVGGRPSWWEPRSPTAPRVEGSGRTVQEASFFTVVVWRDQAEHVAESLSKGSRPEQ